jgi:hypothetical protein
MKIVIVNGDTWRGLYINGVLVCQGHNVTARELGEAICERLPRLDMTYDEKYADLDWLDGEGYLPETLEEVKFEDG